MQQCFVLLSEQDTDAPWTGGAATVSSTDEWEDGGFRIGADCAARGGLWCDRPYWTGNPTADWLLARVNKVTDAGGYCQLGNELNLDLEGFVGGPDVWFRLEDQVRAQADHPEKLLSMPPSPGVPGWEAWVRREGNHACHAYGSCAQMRDAVEWFLANTDGDVYVTEANFGAGNAVDVDRWANEQLIPFLDWTAAQPRVRMVAYFAWVWHYPPTLPTPVDAKGTAVETVIRDWRPGAGGGEGVADITLSVPTQVAIAHPSNYEKGPRASTIGVVIHTTRGNAATPQQEFESTVKWFQNPAADVSAHLVVAEAAAARSVHDPDIAWHARSANKNHFGIEIAQATPTTPITEGQYRTAAEACRKWAQIHGFPLRRVMDIATPGLIGHEDTAEGKKDGKSDPGVRFDWDHFLLCCRGVPPSILPELQQRAWDLAGALQEVAGDFEGIGWPSTAVGIAAAAESAKSHVRASKGEQ